MSAALAYLLQHLTLRRHNTQHNKIQHNDTLHEGLICDTQPLSLNGTQHYNTAIMLSVAFFYDMLSGVMLNIVKLSSIMPNVVILSVVMLNVIILSVVVLSVVMLNVIMRSVVMLSVVVPCEQEFVFSFK